MTDQAAEADDEATDDTPTLIGLEYVVDDLDRALEFFVDLLGFVEVARQAHPHVDAEIVTLDAGAVAINLLHRTAVGDRPPILEPEVSLTQMLFTVPGTSQLDDLRTRLAEAGTGIVVDDPSTIFLSAQGTRAILGKSPALVFRVAADAEQTTAPDTEPGAAS